MKKPGCIGDRIFRFKKFELSNSASAMKVGTDGVLLGAWCLLGDARVVWDVGCGTGLIALMLAQRGASSVIAIDVDSGTCEEARFNVGNSPWSDVVSVVEGDVSEVYGELACPDLIVSNPPYFSDSLKSPDKHRCCARHEESLSYGSLIAIASEVLSEHGRLCMISPVTRRGDIEWECLLRKLYVQRVTEVCPVDGRPATRLLWEVGRNRCVMAVDGMNVRDAGNEYSDDYKSITGDFYLEF